MTAGSETVLATLSLEEWVERARSLLPALRDRTEAANRARRIPAETIADLHRTGLLRVLQPPRFGGLGGDCLAFTEVVNALAHGCGSSAWVFGVLAEHNWMIANFPEEVQREVWGADPHAVASSSFAPRGTCARVPGGYRLSGEWPFSSGCDHAQWAFVGAFVDGPGAGRHSRTFLVPMCDIEIVDDWRVLGLAATGSKTLRLREAFVPEARSLGQEEIRWAATPGRRLHGDLLMSRMPRMLFGSFTLASVLAGLAQRAVELFVDGTLDRVSRGIRVADLDSTQLNVAEAAAEADTAALLVRDACRRNIALVASGTPITDGDLARTRRDAVYCARLASRAVERVYHASGASVLDLDHPMRLVFCDATAAAAHVFLNWELGARPFGQALLGLPIDAAML
jgi:alkylation response protein AidB-like acyl-CoA dehydrogenase